MLPKFGTLGLCLVVLLALGATSYAGESLFKDTKSLLYPELFVFWPSYRVEEGVKERGTNTAEQKVHPLLCLLCSQ